MSCAGSADQDAPGALPPAGALRGHATVDDAISGETEISVMVFDEHFTMLSAAGGALTTAGLDPAEMIGRKCADIFPAQAWDRMAGPVGVRARGAHQHDAAAERPDGLTWFSIHTRPIPGPSPKAIAVSTTLSDPRAGAAVALTDVLPATTPTAGAGEDSIFEVAFAGASVGMAIVDMRERWVRVNDAFCTFVGRSPNELRTITFRDLTEEPVADREEMLQLISGELPRITTEQRYRHKHGHWVTALLSLSVVRDGNGLAQLFVAQIADITERKANEAKLRRLATTDDLTGLANRHGIELALDDAVAAKHGTALLLDIDGFKHTNDGFGHTAGDAVLKAVAARLRDCTDADAVIGRIGGDEFAVVLPSGRPEEAQAVASELADWIASTTVTIAPGATVSPLVSIGAVVIDDQVDNGAAVLLASDIAMFDAKDRGGNQAVLYGGDVTAHARASDDLRWLTTLRRALTEDRFELHLQAIVDLQTGEPVRYEALLRLRGEDGQLLFPGSFMPAAERLKLMRDIDEWVVMEAAEYAAAYSGVTLSVNLSGSSVGDPTLADRIEQILLAAQCDPASLIFETEVIANLDQARTLLVDQLVEFGCQFALDDFGSGYASFSHLKRLPISVVKIDGQFVRELATNPTTS